MTQEMPKILYHNLEDMANGCYQVLRCLWFLTMLGLGSERTLLGKKADRPGFPMEPSSLTQHAMVFLYSKQDRGFALSCVSRVGMSMLAGHFCRNRLLLS